MFDDLNHLKEIRQYTDAHFSGGANYKLQTNAICSVQERATVVELR